MFYSKKSNRKPTAALTNYFWGVCLLFGLLLSYTTSSYAQDAIVTGYEHSNFQGGSDELNKTGAFCHYNGPNGPFANDTYSSMKVKEGYYVFIAEDCNGGSTGGSNKVIIGNVADFGALWGDDKQWWHDRVSAVSIEKMSQYDLDDIVEAGVTQMYNPYRNSYVRSGMQAGTNERVETTNENFRYNSQKKPQDSEFWFAFIKNQDGDYYIFNTASGKALMPEGADKPDFGQIKPGVQLTSYEFGGQEKWATFKITSIGLDRYIISPKSNPKLALTMSPNSSSGGLTFEVNTTEAGQQFFIGTYKMRFGDKVTPPKINKNAPVKEQYSLLEYSGAGESSPHKKISVKVPFYMVRDPEIKSFQEKMNKSPYYTLERVEFVKSKTGSEWKYNRGNSDFSFGNSMEETNTSGSSNEVSVNTGFEQSFTVEASSLFLTASATTTFSLDLGFSHNWYKEYSKTIGASTDMTIKPCSKGKLYALANRITLKRQDGSIAKSFVIYKEGSEQFTSVPLAPDECLDLGKKEYEDAKFRYERYNKLTSSNTNTNTEATITTTAKPTTQPSTTPIAEATNSPIMPKANACYYIESKSVAEQVWDVYNHSKKNGDKIGAWTKNKGANQQFQAIDSGDGYYFFQNVGSGKAATWAHWNEFIQWDKDGGDNQQFKLMDTGDGYLYLELRKNPDHVVTLSNGTLTISPNKNSDNQKFKLVACDTSGN